VSDDTGPFPGGWCNRGLVRENADDVGAPLDLAVETFDRIERMDFRPVVLREAHGGEDIRSALYMSAANLGTLGAPAIAFGLGVVLR
jgi:hypothetical protein